MLKIILIFILLIAGTIPNATCLAGGFEYEIYVGDKLLGTTELVTEMGFAEGHVVITVDIKTKLRAKALFVTVFSLDEEARYVFDGLSLKHYESKAKIDGKKTLSIAQRTDKGLLLTITTEDETVTHKVLNNQFDFTSLEDPEDNLAPLGQPAQFRVLDMDLFKVVKSQYTWLRNETVTAAGTEFPCRVIEIHAEANDRIQWLARDPFNTLIKEEGVDEDGAYHLQLKSYSCELLQNASKRGTEQ